MRFLAEMSTGEDISVLQRLIRLVSAMAGVVAGARRQGAHPSPQDVENLYSLSRSILLMENTESLPKELAQKLAAIFQFSAVVLHVPTTGAFYRGGPEEFLALNEHLEKAAKEGSRFSDARGTRVVVPVRLGSKPTAAVGVQGAAPIPDTVLQGIANLMAIGLERAHSEELAHENEAARRTEHLRTTLLDAMSQELKTPLTSIKAATTALRAAPELPADSRMELIAVADDEAERLREIIDNAVEMGRLDASEIALHVERSDLAATAREVLMALRDRIEDRPVELDCVGPRMEIAYDRRMIRLALRQLVDNALKYSPPQTAITVRITGGPGSATVDVTDHGTGIPVQEQTRIFERFYRSPSVQQRIPGAGLGLTISRRIVQAHGGELTLSSTPEETTFRLTLPRGPAVPEPGP